jgi:hypothetical protein
MKKKVVAVALLLFIFGASSVFAQEVKYSVPEVTANKVEKKSTTKKAPVKKKTKKKTSAKKPSAKKKATPKPKAKKEDIKDLQDGVKEMRSSLKDSKKDLDDGLKDIEDELKKGNVKVQHIVPRKRVNAAMPKEGAITTGLRSFGLDSILSLIGGMFIP